jgi:hypothetical protein
VGGEDGGWTRMWMHSSGGPSEKIFLANLVKGNLSPPNSLPMLISVFLSFSLFSSVSSISTFQISMLELLIISFFFS